MTVRSALAVIVALAGCAGSVSKNTPWGPLPAGCQTDGSDPVAAEACIGWVLDRLLMTEVWKEHPDRDLAVYVGAVGLRMAAAGRVRGVQVRVLDEEEPQGWSLPGGYVYVTRGALAHLDSEAELAALLGHEIGHLAAGHGEDLFATGGPPEPSAVLGLLEHERDEERQADELAVGYLIAAGYPPHAIASMLVNLETAATEMAEARARQSPAPVDADADDASAEGEHPALPARIARALLIAHGHTGGDLGAQRYRAHTASLRADR